MGRGPQNDRYGSWPLSIDKESESPQAQSPILGAFQGPLRFLGL